MRHRKYRAIISRSNHNGFQRHYIGIGSGGFCGSFIVAGYARCAGLEYSARWLCEHGARLVRLVVPYGHAYNDVRSRNTFVGRCAGGSNNPAMGESRMNWRFILPIATAAKVMLAWLLFTAMISPDAAQYVSHGIGLSPSIGGRLLGSVGWNGFAMLNAIAAGACVYMVGAIAGTIRSMVFASILPLSFFWPMFLTVDTIAIVFLLAYVWKGRTIFAIASAGIHAATIPVLLALNYRNKWAYLGVGIVAYAALQVYSVAFNVDNVAERIGVGILLGAVAYVLAGMPRPTPIFLGALIGGVACVTLMGTGDLSYTYLRYYVPASFIGALTV
jgi:hypothetical protein